MEVLENSDDDDDCTGRFLSALFADALLALPLDVFGDASVPLEALGLLVVF